MMDTAKKRLRTIIPHLEIAKNMGYYQVPNSKTELGVIAKAEDGTGKVVASFEFEQFLEDLKEISEYKGVEDE